VSIIWPDFDENSEASRKLIRNKQINDETYWPTMREIFAYDCQKLPLNRFRLWASIHNVPLVTQYRTSRFFGETFYHAARDPKIAEVLQENWIGIPEAMKTALYATNDYDTSTQRVQDIAHLLICGFTPEMLSGYESIVEIGAGYGNMCSVIHGMGFKGKYTIVDIPELQPVHKHYLNKQDIEPNFSFEDDNVSHADLVVSTWALSETPLDYRERLMPKIDQSKNWLILAQSKIFGWDHNEDYFKKFFADKNCTSIPLISDGLNKWDGGNNYYVVKQ